MLEYLAYLVVPTEFFAVQPDALSHQEWVIAHAFARLNLKTVKELTEDPGRLRRLGRAAAELGVPNACRNITEELLKLYQSRKK